MLTFSIQSGSNGNSYYYESGDVKIIVDAGISWRCANERLSKAGIDNSNISAIFVSHEHSDHVSRAGVFHRKTGAPLFISHRTFQSSRHALGKIRPGAVEHFVPGERVDIRHVRVETIPTPHDAVDPCCFIIDDGTTRVGIMTDLGHGFPQLHNCLSNLDVVFLESNYDEDLLANGFYPESLKNRIRGPHGHLENSESALLMRRCNGGRTKAVFLSHLSQDNNRPDLALSTHLRLAGNHRPKIGVAPRDGRSAVVQFK